MLITPEIGKEKGGIQNWMYFVEKLFNHNNFTINVYAYKEDKLSKLLKVFFSNIFFLATWKMVVFILPIAFFTNKKFFIFIHGNEILNVNKLFFFLLHYLTKRKNTYFIANSQAVANLFQQLTKRDVDYVQHPFIKINPSKIIDKKETKNIFFTVTRLVKRKNIDRVIKAFGILKNEGFNFLYYIAGSGSETEYLQKLIKDLGLENEIKFLGKISEEEKNNLYKKAHYFLLPSLFDKVDGSIEGYGIVFIEANTYGIPVLSGDSGGMVEAVVDRETGYHCDGSIEDIKRKIIKLVDTGFDTKTICEYASKHHYLEQEQFIAFIKDKIHE